MGCARGCLRCLIGITSVILLIIALICLGIGVFLKTGLSKVVNHFLEPSLKSVRTVSKNVEYMETPVDEGDGEIDVMPMVEPVAIFLIVIGVVLFVVAFLGLFGSCCNSRLLLALYAIVLTVVIIVQLILIIVFFTKGFDGHIRGKVESTLIEPYKGVNDFSASSLAANAMMFHFKCCGIDSYEDFSKATDWRKVYTYKVKNRPDVTVTLKTPLACCKMSKTETGSGDSEGFARMEEKTCAESPNDANSNWKTGCWGEISKELEGHRPKAIGVIVVILIIQVIFLIMAVAVVCLLKDNSVSV